VSIPLLKDVKSQAPNAICEVEPNNVSTNIIVNSTSPPFDNPDNGSPNLCFDSILGDAIEALSGDFVDPFAKIGSRVQVETK
jgi:hypothetical protein